MSKRGRTKPRLKSAGLSILGFGASAGWDYGPDEREIIRKLVSRLEDRRVLYAPFFLEVPRQVTESIQSMRDMINDALADLPEDSNARAHLRLMRSACRKFLSGNHTQIQVVGMPFTQGEPHGLTPGFFVALGELRAVFGQQIAGFASVYDLDVEDELASIFPPVDE